MLERNYYLQKIKPYIKHWQVKSLYGMRGIGKTVIFNQIIKYLKQEKKVDDFHIIYINFEYTEFEHLRNFETLQNYVDSKITDSDFYYIFLDEVQHLDSLDDFLKSFDFVFNNLSFFVTSSNSYFYPEYLSLTGSARYMLIPVTTLTFIETCTLLNLNPHDKTLLQNYLKYGGLPSRFQYKKSTDVKYHLYSLLDSIYLRDIAMRFNFQELNQLNTVLKHLLNYLGKDFIFNDLKDSLIKEKISEETFLNCLTALKTTNLIQCAPAYDVYNRTVLYQNERYYISDFGLAYVRGYDATHNMEAALKNLIWLELKRKGYTLYTGVKGNEKIDIIAMYDDIIMYIQVVSNLEDGNMLNKQIEILSNFKAYGSKYLLSLDTTNYSRKDIIHKNIIDFLLDKSIDINDEVIYIT